MALQIPIGLPMYISACYLPSRDLEWCLRVDGDLCSEDAADDAAGKAKSAGKDAKGNVKSAADDVKVCC